MPLQALIFDVDGTIADTERHGHRLAFNLAFADAELDWVWSEKLYGELLHVAGGKERIRYYLQQMQAPIPYAVADLDTWIAELHRAKSAIYNRYVGEGYVPPRPGVVRLLKEARESGIRLAIATTSALSNVLALLETAIAPDAADWFEVIAAGDVVPRKKPAPDIYSYALERLQVAPEDCVAIEDSYQGLTAATGAGLRTIVTVNRYTEHEDLSAATLVLEHLGEVDQVPQVLRGTMGGSQWLDLGVLQRLV